MNKETLKKQLDEAERYVSRGKQRVTRKCEFIAKLERDNQDTTSARKLLNLLITVQLANERRRDRLSRELG